MPDDWESPKEEVRAPTRQLEGCFAWPPLLAAPGTLLGAWWPLSVPPLAPIFTPEEETPNIEVFSPEVFPISAAIKN